MPFFSIIIPVYNVAQYLRECLDSVLAQTFTNWEAICVDDGSCDSSGAILDEYAARDGRIKAIHQKNVGVGVARNAAIDLAVGEYVTFLDADDVYAQDWLKNAYNILLATPVDLLRFRCTVWNSSEDTQPKIVPAATELKIFEDRSAVSAWGKVALLHEGWCWVLFLRRTILERNKDCRFPAGMRVWEDNIFCFSLLPFVQKACQGEYAGYLYRQRHDSACCRRIGDADIHRFLAELVRIGASYDIVTEELSKVIFRWIVVWRRYRGAHRRDCEKETVGLLRKLLNAHQFSIDLVPLKWRIAFYCLLWTSSFILLDAFAGIDRMRGHDRSGLWGSAG